MESKKNIYKEAETNTQNVNFMIRGSQSSTFVQISNDNQNFKKLEKNGKKIRKIRIIFNTIKSVFYFYHC